MEVFDYIENIPTDKKEEINKRELCRTCGGIFKNASSMRTLQETFSEFNENLINEFIKVELEDEEEICLPEQICDECFNQFTNIWQFYIRCRNSQISLLKYFKSISPNGDNQTQSDMSQNSYIYIETKDGFELTYIKTEDGNNFQNYDELKDNDLLNVVEVDIPQIVPIENVNNLVEKKIKTKQSRKPKTKSSPVTRKYVSKNRNSKVKINEGTEKIEKKSYICVLCDKECFKKSELTIHTNRVHKKQDRFICDICGATYKIKSALEGHIKRHKGEVPFKCAECDKSFVLESTLQRHMSIHTGKKSYQCDKCGKQFIHYSSFKMHNLMHGDIRPVKCEDCGILFRSTSHLSRHKLVHTGAKPHACPKCGQRFAQKYNMTSHIKSHHEGIRRQKRQKDEKLDEIKIEDTAQVSYDSYEIVFADDIIEDNIQD